VAVLAAGLPMVLNRHRVGEGPQNPVALTSTPVVLKFAMPDGLGSLETRIYEWRGNP
jgi:hypothetical protein